MKFKKEETEFYFLTGYIMIVIVSLILIICTVSCCSVKKKSCYVQRSEIAITNDNHKIIYIKNNITGQIIYEHWAKGFYGDAYKPMLISDSLFNYIIKTKNVGKL